MIQVAIANHQHLVRVDKPALRRITRTVLTGEGVRRADISLAFVDNVTSRRLNRQFLRHAGATDVITFPFSAAGEQPLSGELVICTEVARQAARKQGHSVKNELALYVIHGLLHLCSYDDRKQQDRRAMREREAHYLERLDVRLNGPVE